MSEDGFGRRGVRMTKKKDELSSFRIADVKRPEVRSFTKAEEGGQPGVTKEASASVGFPAIEARLERGTIDELADELRPSYEKLEALSESGDMKTKAAAKRAMAAYERAADLFEYLFETKATMTKTP